MIKIKMLKTTPGSLDGFTRIDFNEEQTYEVPDELAKAFVKDMGVAVIVRERKAISAAPEKAVIETALGNKEEEEKTDDFDVEKKPREMVRVFQLADELGVSSKEIIKKAKELGLHAKAPVSGLFEEDAEKIKANM